MKVVRERVRSMTRVLVAGLILGLSAQAFAQLAPTGDHYGGRASDTGFSGKVNAAGGYYASIPFDFAAIRGGIPNPVQIGFGGHVVGTAGVGWDLPISYVRVDDSITKRKPRNIPNAAVVGRRHVTMSLDGQSMNLVPKADAWVAATDAAMFEAHWSDAGWTVDDGQGHRYSFTQSVSSGLWLLTSVEGPSGTLMNLQYDTRAVNLTGGRATSVDLTGVSYNYNPALGCAKDVITLAYGETSSTPLSLSVMPSVFVRMRTLDHIDVRMRSSCSDIVTVRSYAFHYSPDVDTQLPRLDKVTMSGRADTAESTTMQPVASYRYGSASRDGQIVFAPIGTIAAPNGVDSNQVTSASKVSMSLPGTGQSYATFQSFTDLTGDGRPDFLFENLGTLWMAKNHPAGDVTPAFAAGTLLGDTAVSISGPVAANTLTRTRFEDDIKANTSNDWRQLIDINGDGRVDMIDAAKRDDVWTVYLNTPGTGASGVAWEERVIPVKQLRDRLAMYGHTFPDAHHLPLSRHYTARVYYTNDVGDVDSTENEFTYTEWELKDINGDGLPDFVFNTLPVQVQVSQVSSTQWIHRPLPGPGANAVETMFNVGGVTLSGPSASPTQEVFSSPSILTENTSCGVEMWEETDYQHPNQGTRQSLRCTLADVTGDGIVDRIDHDHALIGLGAGFSPITIPLPVDFVGQQFANQRVLCLGNTGASVFQSMIQGGLRDITGDGIADLIVSGVPDTIYVGTGFGFSATPLHGQIGNLSSQMERCDGTSSFTQSGLFDVDGDGRPDYVDSPANGTYRVSSLSGGSAAGIPEAGQLVAVDNGYGATTDIAYSSAKRDATTAHDVPFPEIVVASVRTRRVGETAADALAPTTYAYGNPSMVYDNVVGAFVFAGYQRSVSLRATGSNSDTYVGQAVITDTLGLSPFGGGTALDRYSRRALVGRVSSVTTLAGTLGIDAWSLLGTNVETDYRQTARTTFTYASRLFVEQPSSEPMLDCLDWPTPYDYDGSFGQALLGYDTCSSHGFTYTAETLALRGEPIANQNNVWTRMRVLDVDDYGRATRVAYDNDVFRDDDDLCVDTTYATPANGGWRILAATATQYVSSTCGERPVPLRRDTYELDNLPVGSVSKGNETSHTIDYYATDNGDHTSQVRLFDATYDALGNMIQTISVRNDGVYRESTLTYDPFGLAVTSSQTSGTNVQTLSTVIDLDPVTLSPVVYTDENGTKRKLTYDGFGRILTTSLAQPGSATFGVVSLTSYSGFSPPSAVREVTTTTFDEPTPVAQVDVKRGHMTHTLIDELGRVNRQERSLGSDYNGQVLVTGYRTFDAFGRVAFEAEPFLSTDSPATAYGTTHYYQPDGRPSCSVLAQGPHAFTAVSDLATETFARCFYHGYSNHLETVGTSDPDANQPGAPQAGVLRLDTLTAIGRLVSRATTRQGQRLEFSTFGQDRFGNTVRESRFKNLGTNPPSSPVTSWSRFDSGGHVLEQKDPEGLATRTEVDSWGAATAIKWTDAASIDHRIVATYDAYGRMLHRDERHNGVVDAETVNDFTYDMAQPVASQITPTNLLGRMSASHAASGDTYFSYDENGATNATVWNDGAGQQYLEKLSHRIDGTMTSMDLFLPDRNYDPEHVDFSYDSAKRLVAATYSSSTQHRTLYKVSSHDPYGRIVNVNYGATSLKAAFSQNGRRLPKYSTLSSPLGSRRFEYGSFDAMGRELWRAEDNATDVTQTAQTYDAIGRLVGSTETRAGQTTAQWSYSYDPLGNMSASSNAVTSATTSMTYRAGDEDELCRVDYAAPTGTACNVAHDSFGNVRSMPSRTGTRTLDYFLSGRVRTIKDPRATATFRYNPFGGVQDVHIEGVFHDERDEQTYGNIVVRTSTPAGPRGVPTTTITRNFPGPGATVSLRGTGTIWLYAISDARGLRVTTSAEGNFVQDVRYQPYGVATSSGQSTASPLYTFDQWNGGDALTNFGLSQLGARIYDPILGRFLSRDPLTIFRTAATSNPYAFAANDPVNHSDPTGLDWGDCIGQECLGLDWFPWDTGGGSGGSGNGHGNQDNTHGTPAAPLPTMPPMTGMTGGACQFADGSAGCNDSMWPTFHHLSGWQRFGRGWVAAGDKFQDGVARAVNFIGDHPGPFVAAGVFVATAFFAPEVIPIRVLGYFMGALGFTLEDDLSELPAVGEAAAETDAVIPEEEGPIIENRLFSPLGRGSTANGTDRWLPRTLREQLAEDQVMQNPAAGRTAAGPMNDPRWPASDGWVKLQQTVDPGGREGKISVHYNYNTLTNEVDDFKIIKRDPYLPPDDPTSTPTGQ